MNNEDATEVSRLAGGLFLVMDSDADGFIGLNDLRSHLKISMSEVSAEQKMRYLSALGVF
jgi:Ca2+-binding EF-hand superfamily protein